MHRCLLLAVLFATALVEPRAAAQGLSSPLYAPRIPVDARLETVWQWDLDGHGISPIALDAHASGVICGIEGRRHRLFLTDSLGRGLRLAARAGAGQTLAFATRVFARSGLQIFTLDSWNRQIERFDLRGDRERGLDLARAAEDAGEDLGEIVDFCMDLAGDLFALDARRGRILHFDREGALERVLGESGEIAFEAPVAIDVDGRGRLFLLETRPPSVIVLDPDGRLVRRALALDEQHETIEPAALAVDLWGNVFVGDAGSGDVLALPERGGPAWWIRPPGEERVGMLSDIAVVGVRRLLVADARRERVWVFALRYRDPLPVEAGGAKTGDARHAR